MLYFGFNVDLV